MQPVGCTPRCLTDAVGGVQSSQASDDYSQLIRVTYDDIPTSQRFAQIVVGV